MRPRGMASRSSARWTRPGRIVLISSQVPQPTSPTHSSPVAGWMAIRKGFRRPYATIRLPFVVGSSSKRGLSARGGAFVVGLTRMMEPLRPSGSPVVRMSCERSPPPCPVACPSLGRLPLNGSPHGFWGVGVDGSSTAPLTPVGSVEVCPVATAEDQRALGVEDDVAHRVAGVLLAPVVDEHLLVRAVRQDRQAPADNAAILRRPGRIRAGSLVPPGDPQRGAACPMAASYA